MLKLHNPDSFTLRGRAPRSWFSEIEDSFINGVEGRPPVAIDTSRPVGAALAPLVGAAQNLGSTLTASAQAGVDAYLTAHVGPAGPVIEQLALQALLSAVQSRLK